DVEPGPADDDGQPTAAANRRDRGLRVPGEAGRIVCVVGIDDIDQVMHDRRPILRRGLAGRGVHAAIDLTRVSGDHLDRQPSAARDGGRGFADARRSRDHEERWVARHRSQSTPSYSLARLGRRGLPQTRLAGGSHYGPATSYGSHYLPVPLELAADVLHRYAAHDRPAVRAEVRGPRPPEIRDEPIHLLARQRRVGLDRTSTRPRRPPAR